MFVIIACKRRQRRRQNAGLRRRDNSRSDDSVPGLWRLRFCQQKRLWWPIPTSRLDCWSWRGVGGGGVGAAHSSTKVDGGTKTTFTHTAEVFRRDGSLDRLSYLILKTMSYDSDKSARNSRLKFNQFFDLVIEKYREGFCSERLVVMSLLLLLLQH